MRVISRRAATPRPHPPKSSAKSAAHDAEKACRGKSVRWLGAMNPPVVNREADSHKLAAVYGLTFGDGVPSDSSLPLSRRATIVNLMLLPHEVAVRSAVSLSPRHCNTGSVEEAAKLPAFHFLMDPGGGCGVARRASWAVRHESAWPARVFFCRRSPHVSRPAPTSTTPGPRPRPALSAYEHRAP